MPCRTIWSFAPQVTVIGDIPVPSTTPPNYTKRSDVLFTYPFVSPSTSVTLRSPEFGDTRTITVESVRKSTLANVFTIGRNPIWPIVEIFSYVFTALTDEQVADYFAFTLASAGREIGIRDHRGQSWRGFILNPDGESTNDQTCNNDLEITIRATFVGP